MQPEDYHSPIEQAIYKTLQYGLVDRPENCPPVASLERLVAGKQGGTAASELLYHISLCRSCRDDYRALLGSRAIELQSAREHSPRRGSVGWQARTRLFVVRPSLVATVIGLALILCGAAAVMKLTTRTRDRQPQADPALMSMQIALSSALQETQRIKSDSQREEALRRQAEEARLRAELRLAQAQKAADALRSRLARQQAGTSGADRRVALNTNGQADISGLSKLAELYELAPNTYQLAIAGASRGGNSSTAETSGFAPVHPEGEPVIEPLPILRWRAASQGSPVTAHLYNAQHVLLFMRRDIVGTTWRVSPADALPGAKSHLRVAGKQLALVPGQTYVWQLNSDEGKVLMTSQFWTIDQAVAAKYRSVLPLAAPFSYLMAGRLDDAEHALTRIGPTSPAYPSARTLLRAVRKAREIESERRTAQNDGN